MSDALREIITKRIKAEGGISVADYMDLCLGHPEHGYYMTRDPFGQHDGAGGDFTTAPEISQMFGEMIGAWLIDSWYKLGAPDPFILCECGPGRGTLMHDILRTAKLDPKFLQAVDIYLVEISPILKEAQKKALTSFDDCVTINWCKEISMLPDHAPVILIANEFLDALPVRQFTFKAGQWAEDYIDLDSNGSFRFCGKLSQNSDSAILPKMLFPPKEGEQMTISTAQDDFVCEVINIIKKQQGIALFIDYGFTLPSYGTTLQAVMNHQFVDVLDSPGECDITAHVNFAHLGDVILSNDMTLHGPVSQGGFLKRLGIDTRAQNLKQNASSQQGQDIDSALTRLVGNATKNNQMGDLFKVIAFTDNPHLNLEGFA